MQDRARFSSAPLLQEAARSYSTFEWAAVQHFNEQFDAGLVGYYYNQVTGDSGAGATIG
jgi:hypothetical protein